MNISDLSIFVVIIGWGVVSYFNRKHERLKKRTEYRLRTLESFIPIQNSFTSSSAPFEKDVELKSKIEQARVNFFLYGYQDEIELYEKFIKSIEKSNIPETVETINILIKIVRNRLRKELELPQIKD